jgi:hypothetical protein
MFNDFNAQLRGAEWQPRGMVRRGVTAGTQ